MKRWLVRLGVKVIAIAVALGLAAVGLLLWQIQRAVQRQCQAAQASHPHPGDDVAALLDCVRSEEHPLSERNLAVWTLGRLADPRALPVLESFVTGGPCDHDYRLCQHELAKAIKRCRANAASGVGTFPRGAVP